jgi:hypothetical protein
LKPSRFERIKHGVEWPMPKTHRDGLPSALPRLAKVSCIVCSYSSTASCVSTR